MNRQGRGLWHLLTKSFSPKIPVTLLSKADCGLCQEALAEVSRAFGAESVRVVDIIGNRELEDLYIFRIPVLIHDGVVIAEGRITRDDARSALRSLQKMASQR